MEIESTEEDKYLEIYQKYQEGQSIKSLMAEYHLNPKQWKKIKESFEQIDEDNEEEDSEEEEEKPNKGSRKTPEQKVEKAAETSAIDIAVKTTKVTAKDIQETKFQLGDSLYNILFAAGIPNDKMMEFVAEALGFYLQNYDSIEKLKEKLETSERLIDYFTDIFDDRKQLLNLVQKYQESCIANGTSPDPEYVLSLFRNAMLT